MTSAQGLQEKIFKAVQDSFGTPGTGWKYPPHKKKKNLNKTSMEDNSDKDLKQQK
jgi:hypothetical protein